MKIVQTRTCPGCNKEAKVTQIHEATSLFSEEWDCECNLNKTMNYSPHPSIYVERYNELLLIAEKLASHLNEWIGWAQDWDGPNEPAKECLKLWNEFNERIENDG